MTGSGLKRGKAASFWISASARLRSVMSRIVPEVPKSLLSRAGLRVNLDPAKRSIAGQVAGFIPAVALLALDQLLEQLPVPFPILRMDVVGKGRAQVVLDLEAGDFRPGRIEESPAPGAR